MSLWALCVVAFSSGVTAQPTKNTNHQVKVPVFYTPTGDLGKAATNVSWGTPKQHPVTTTFDTGSTGFWVDTQLSNVVAEDVNTINSSCVYPVYKYLNVYNYTTSKSHSPIIASPPKDSGFSYGNSKFVSTPTSLNDTMSWTANSLSLPNQRVALATNTTTQVQGSSCDGIGYSTDSSILGMGPGSSWRANLLASGVTTNLDWSMWFRENKDTAVSRTFHGAANIGGPPPTSAYCGDLVSVPITKFENSLFYSVATPTLKVGSKEIPLIKGASTSMIIDSGTISDMIPFNHKQMVEANVGLVYYVDKGGFIYFSYNGTCASIPEDLTLDYTFAGEKHQNITVKIPIRNYATEAVPGRPHLCNLGNLQTDNVGDSFFGIPFFTGATMYFQDAVRVIGLAQGGVAQ